jgi:simple sugar transport system permease protein
MDEILGQIFQIGFFAAMIRIATPLIFATIGELFAERAGVLNLGIEGIMLLSAMVGFSAAYFSGSLWLGVAAAMATGVVSGMLMGLLTVTLGLSQHVSGIGVTLLNSGLAFFLYRLIFGQPVGYSRDRPDPVQSSCAGLRGLHPGAAGRLHFVPHPLGPEPAHRG